MQVSSSPCTTAPLARNGAWRWLLSTLSIYLLHKYRAFGTSFVIVHSLGFGNPWTTGQCRLCISYCWYKLEKWSRSSKEAITEMQNFFNGELHIDAEFLSTIWRKQAQVSLAHPFFNLLARKYLSCHCERTVLECSFLVRLPLFFAYVHKSSACKLRKLAHSLHCLEFPKAKNTHRYEEKGLERRMMSHLTIVPGNSRAEWHSSNNNDEALGARELHPKCFLPLAGLHTLESRIWMAAKSLE